MLFTSGLLGDKRANGLRASVSKGGSTNKIGVAITELKSGNHARVRHMAKFGHSAGVALSVARPRTMGRLATFRRLKRVATLAHNRQAPDTCPR